MTKIDGHEVGAKCPECNGSIVEKRIKTGAKSHIKYAGCSSCSWKSSKGETKRKLPEKIVWNPETPRAGTLCPKCKKGGVVGHYVKAGKVTMYWDCDKKTCTWKKKMKGKF